MDDTIKWLLTSGNQLTVGGLLVAGFALTVVALYREWIVLGKPYHACMARVEEFEEQATERAKANEAKVAQLEAKLQEIQAREGRRR